MDLSIIIVSWNVADLLVNCLNSILTHPPSGSFEILVVDNASSDDSVRVLREKFPQIRLILNDQNVGFAGANNQAMRAAEGRHVLLLNPDTIVFEGTLQHLVDGVKQGGADAVLAASIFHFAEYSIGEAKRFMAAQGVEVRL